MPDAVERRQLTVAHQLTVAFESHSLSYSDHLVDLYNSGVNQLLSLAAARGHRIRHFRMADLYRHLGTPRARTSVLELDDSWDGDPLSAWRHLRKVGEETLPLDAIDLYFVRGDDIRRADTPNLDVLREAELTAPMLETAAATLATTDKYALVERVPHASQPVTYTASDIDAAMDAIRRLPDAQGWFVLKDRFGYGCGAQVHRLHREAPALEHIVQDYLGAYGDVLLQEFCPDVAEGDLVVTFWDGELIAAMRRIPADDQWKSNASFGASHVAHELTREQAATAWAVRRAYPECRLASVDLLMSGRALEINAFPGASGLLETYGIVLAQRVLDTLEAELAAAAERAPHDAHPRHVGHRLSDETVKTEVFDVFADEIHTVEVSDVIEVRQPDPAAASPVVLSVPHSGVLIPTRFIDRFPRDDRALVEIDLLSHLPYEQLPVTQLFCRLAPYFLDMNRARAAAEEPHVPGHLRNAPHNYYTVDDEPILQRAYSTEEEHEVLRWYDLYHELLDDLMLQARHRHGWALLVDGHSMTSVGLGRVHDEGAPRDNFVVGTLDGTSADSAIIEAFLGTLRDEITPYDLGLTVASDNPYSGGFITRKHHDPANGLHAIQVEVTMETYMYEADEPDPSRRYAIKQHRLDIVRTVLARAVEAAVAAGSAINASTSGGR
jgi:N-formylglutamate amidohydrolase/glutathione synthase/RimK-type ligase-like ATP-grasp enzyme